jgi:predicted DNA-binding protein with PD1-like motif
MKINKSVKTALLITMSCFLFFCMKADAQEYWPPTKAVQTGRSPGVRVRMLFLTSSSSGTYAIVFAPGDEIMSGLTEFAEDYGVKSAHFTAIGDVRAAKLGWYDQSKKMFKVNAVNEQCEVTSLIGDIAIYNGKPVVHAHINLATSDGIVHGGHLLEAFVTPTLEVMMTTEYRPLYKKFSPEFGGALIDPAIKRRPKLPQQ